MKRVISLWLPWFATDRLCRLRQDWLDSPLALVREESGRQVLHAVNALAADAGLHAGLSLADARALLPELKTSEADAEAEARALVRLADWCSRYSPWTAPDRDGSGAAFAGAGSVWLDVTGCAHLFGGETALMRDLVGRLDGLGYAAFAAIADTPGAAWAAVRHLREEPAARPARRRRRWHIVGRGRNRDVLAALPVAGLRLPAETVAGLQAVGLRRIGDLMPIPRAALADRFGSDVADRLDQALGERPEPVSPLSPASPWTACAAFPEPVGKADDIAEAVRRLAAELAGTLEADGRGARRLVLAFYHPDGNVDRLEAGTSRASRNAGHLARLFADRLERIDAPFGIDALTLTATATEKLEAAQTALDRRGAEGGGSLRDNAGVAALADRLSTRLGSGSVAGLTLQESHIPERASVAAAAVTARTRPRPAAPWRTRALPRPRPLRLLSRPEEIEAVAPVPDDPPVMFRWRKQVFRIERADGPERIAPEWWNDGLGETARDETEAEETGAEETDAEESKADPGASPIQDSVRDYYRVEDRSGRRFWVYREGVYRPGAQPHWYMHGVFG
jgi:protein ImuB